jgi:hypothetical protein
MSNFIPKADDAINGWQSNFTTKIAPKAPAWNIPTDAVAALQAKKARWTTAYAAASDPATRTKGTVKEKQEARTEYEAALRAFIRTYVAYNPAITDKDREDLGVPVHKSGRTPAPRADKAPVVTVSPAGARQVRFDFGAEKGSAAKPAGQHGAEIAWVIRDEAPASYDDFAHSSFDTHSPLVLSFDLPNAGKRLWFAARWENTRGVKGPWSEIESTIIP